MLSLNARQLLAASLALAAFLGLTGVSLDQAFRASSEAALRERLQAELYTLLAATDIDRKGKIQLAEELPEARFSQPGSGLYAEVVSNNQKQRWSSPSLLGQGITFDARLKEGERRFTQLGSGATLVYAMSFGVNWETAARGAENYTFTVAESADSFNAGVQRFRQILWRWLGASALVLLAVQGTILRWSLAPLRRVEKDLADIEGGAQQRLAGDYPKELQGLTKGLNALLDYENRQLTRYRHALADLAHSLKTPLAVLRGALTSTPDADELRRLTQEQVERMNQIVGYQLQRAATAGRATLQAPVAIAPLLQRMRASLDKVYADKQVDCRINADNTGVFYGDEGDLMELLGNLLDNAYKYCNGKVRITAQPVSQPLHHRTGLVLEIEDDGPGVPPDKLRAVLARGVRADESVSGQGIGLAVAQDIVRAYQGTLDIRASALGGAFISIAFPTR